MAAWCANSAVSCNAVSLACDYEAQAEEHPDLAVSGGEGQEPSKQAIVCATSTWMHVPAPYTVQIKQSAWSLSMQKLETIFTPSAIFSNGRITSMQCCDDTALDAFVSCGHFARKASRCTMHPVTPTPVAVHGVTPRTCMSQLL